MPCLQLLIFAGSAFLLLSIYLYRRPELVLKLIVAVMRRTLMRVRIVGQENIPLTGPVLLVSNHVSLFDLLLLQAASHRPLRFMMSEKVFNNLPCRRLLRGLGLMVVPPPRQTKAMQAFLEHCRNELQKGEILCFLPEDLLLHHHQNIFFLLLVLKVRTINSGLCFSHSPKLVGLTVP